MLAPRRYFPAFCALVVCVAVSAACAPGENVKRAVAARELAGTWGLAPDSVEVISGNGYSLPFEPTEQKIELHADGTCYFATFASVSAPIRPPIAGACHWFVTQYRHPLVMVKIDGGSFTESFEVGERDDELFLSQYAADPDMGRIVIYRRTSAASALIP